MWAQKKSTFYFPELYRANFFTQESLWRNSFSDTQISFIL